jgi:hypothetical protein
MTEYKCPECSKEFVRSRNLDYHVEKGVCDKKIHECNFCCSKFSSKNAMYRHIRESCSVKKMDDERKNQIYERLERLEREHVKMKKENVTLKRKVVKMEKTPKTINNINNNGMINNGTINNNITLVAYGKEDIYQIDRDDIIRALKTGFNSTKHLTEVIHFNPKYPNYSNIKRNNYNMKNKIMYHNGNGWVTTSDPHMIDDLYNRKRDFIEENIEHYQDGLTKGDMTRLQRWLDVDDDDQRITRIKEELRDMLFNKKIIAETNEMNSNVTFVNIEDLDSNLKKRAVKIKKRSIAGRPGTKRKNVKAIRKITIKY